MVFDFDGVEIEIFPDKTRVYHASEGPGIERESFQVRFLAGVQLWRKLIGRENILDKFGGCVGNDESAPPAGLGCKLGILGCCKGLD